MLLIVSNKLLKKLILFSEEFTIYSPHSGKNVERNNDNEDVQSLYDDFLLKFNTQFLPCLRNLIQVAKQSMPERHCCSNKRFSEGHMGEQTCNVHCLIMPGSVLKGRVSSCRNQRQLNWS